ncbi:MAG: 50S ribosomal protein L18 [Candidatus Latescibacterota bacterium]|nr:MAG: 50S ribosomal protein L18 [Candidatus Latescibacterota bacterium]
MKSKAALRMQGRMRRKERVRKKVAGVAERPRLSVFRSLKHISAQIVDDELGKTLVAVTSTSKEFLAAAAGAKGKTAKSAVLGKAIAEKAIELGIKKVRFDRGGYAYHGRIRALAEAARKAGLEF